MNGKYFILIFLISLAGVMQAQLVNNGASIVVKNGATLDVDNDVINTSGIIKLESGAILRVSGDMTNSDSLELNSNSTVEFYGDAASNVTSNADHFGNVNLDKTAANLILADDFFLLNTFDFIGDDNQVELGIHDFYMLTGSGLNSSYDENEYFITDGVGMLRMLLGATGNNTFPVGDAGNYSPIDVNVTAGTFVTDSEVAVNVEDIAHPSLYTDATEHITRFWNVDQSNITGYAATLTGTYVDGDIQGADETLIRGASYTTDWSYANMGNDDLNNQVSGDVSESADFTGMNFFGSLDLKAYLQGTYNGSGMNTTLNSGGELPLTSPYDGSVTVSSIPNADIVDWIEVEARDEANASTVLKSYSVFIKNDGSIVALDGTSLPLFKDSPTSGFVAIRHRNHLGVRSNSTISWDSGSSFDFTDSANQSNVYTNGAYVNGPTVDLGSSIFGLWGGNANGNNNIRFGGPANDRNQLLNVALGGDKTAVLFDQYDGSDMNMNTNIRFGGPANDRNFLLNTVLGGDKTKVIFEHL